MMDDRHAERDSRPAETPEGDSPFERFERLARRVITTPKSAIDKAKKIVAKPKPKGRPGEDKSPRLPA